MLGYTTGQFRAYLLAAQRRERLSLRDRVLAAALAQAEPKALQRTLRDLG